MVELHNVDYFWKDLTDDVRTRYSSVMAKYGKNQWWNSISPAIVASYQVNELDFLADMDVFLEGLKLFNGGIAVSPADYFMDVEKYRKIVNDKLKSASQGLESKLV